MDVSFRAKNEPQWFPAALEVLVATGRPASLLLPVSGEVPVEVRDSRVVPKPVLVESEDRACSKASHTMDSSEPGARNVQ